MNLKKIVVALTLSFILLMLTGCMHLVAWIWAEQSRPKKSTIPDFVNARGGWVSTCGTRSYGLNVKEGHGYLRKHGLPVEIEGNFICTADNKPALPKDCQGKEIRSVEELESFRLKHQLPLGYLYWECSNGVPKVEEQYLENWHRNELERPTCKDERGRPKPCV